MFYSIVYLLFPIWMFYHKREFHNKKTELNNERNHLGEDSSNLICNIDLVSNSPNITHNKIFVFKNKSDGFDFTKNQSNDESKTLQNIFNNFRKLKLLRILQSTSVSEIEKLKYAEEVLSENAVDNSNKNGKTNDFWETYEDMFF